MIEGLKTYGSDKLVKELPGLKNPIFICTIATTETSKIPGLTGAGATPELTKYTPAGDAELILDGEVKCMTDIPQTIIGEVVTPTPSMITKGSLALCDCPVMVLDAGSEIKANSDVFDISDGKHGKDIRTGKAVENPEIQYLFFYEEMVYLFVSISTNLAPLRRVTRLSISMGSGVFLSVAHIPLIRNIGL